MTNNLEGLEFLDKMLGPLIGSRKKQKSELQRLSLIHI